MARLTGKLTDAKIRAAKPPPEGKAKLDDGGGLFVRNQKRAKCWCWRYRLRGKDNTVTLGRYPDVALKEARAKAAELRALVANGIDPAEQRQAERREEARAAPCETVAREWLEQVHRPNVVPEHYSKNVRRLERFILPWLGTRPLDEIGAQELRDCLKRAADAGKVETANRVRILMDQVFAYAIRTERASRNVAADLRGTLPSARKKHHPALTDPVEVGGLLRAIEGYSGTLVVRSALKLTPLVFLRPGELRGATWDEIDLEDALWTIPAARMKGKEGERRDHMVPLATQAVAILRDLLPLTGPEGHVFPAEGRGRSGRPMSENTITAALRSLGYHGRQTPHGFRATARTLLDEQLGQRPDLIEHQLAHAVRDPNGRAYNRTSFLEERRTMMQRWADYLDALQAGGNVVPMQCKGA